MPTACQRAHSTTPEAALAPAPLHGGDHAAPCDGLVQQSSTTRRECLSKIILLGESHLRAAVREYLAHYHEERNHRAWAVSSSLSPANLNRPGPIVCGERLGGLLRFYQREAA